MKKIWPVMFFISLCFNFFLLFQKAPPGAYTVLAVLDGDTILLENKVRLRLRQIDAPELEHCGGEEARQELVRLIGQNKVDLTEQIIDARGRPMAIVKVGKTVINQEMLFSGWAKYHHDTSSFTQDLKQAAAQAKEKSLGIYGRCINTNPPNPNCIIKGNIDLNSPYQKRYYIPGCVHYKTTIIEESKGEQWFCAENEAIQAGYQKASRCP